MIWKDALLKMSHSCNRDMHLSMDDTIIVLESRLSQCSISVALYRCLLDPVHGY